MYIPLGISIADVLYVPEQVLFKNPEPQGIDKLLGALSCAPLTFAFSIKQATWRIPRSYLGAAAQTSLKLAGH